MRIFDHPPLRRKPPDCLSRVFWQYRSCIMRPSFMEPSRRVSGENSAYGQSIPGLGLARESPRSEMPGRDVLSLRER
jgi:hypothetical protein